MNHLSQKILLFTFLVIVSFSARSQTNISGFISANTTWDMAGSPYIVVGNALVSSGYTLTIEPGVVVKFNTDKALQFDGELIAIGTAQNRITFTSNQANPAAGDWAKLHFADPSVDAVFDANGNYLSGSILKYCDVLYGGGLGFGAIHNEYAAPYISKCHIANSESCGMYSDGNSANARVDSSLIENCLQQGLKYKDDFLSITANTFINNGNGGVDAECDNGYQLRSICNNYFISNGGYTLRIPSTGKNLLISGNYFISNIGGNVCYISANATYDKCIIECNSFINNQVQYYIFNFSGSDTCLIRNNTFRCNTSSQSPNIGILPAQDYMLIEDNLFEDNISFSYATFSIRFHDALSMTHNEFRNNISPAIIWVCCPGEDYEFKFNNFSNPDAVYEFYNNVDYGEDDLHIDSNYWGSISAQHVDSAIYDYFDYANQSVVYYSPFLTSPAQIDSSCFTYSCNCIPTYNTISVSTCDSYTSPSGNYVWTATGTYTDIIPNDAGCDSVITANLTILSSSSSINPSTCDSYTSPSGQYVWTSTGTYTDIIPNSAGCDSVITVNLTILSSSSSINPSTCNSYTSPSGNYVWTSTGTYTDIIPNSDGCDSIITVNLTILNSSSTINPSTCDSYTSPSGNYVWTSTGTYTDIIPNAAGCDSVITVNLTILNSTSSIVDVTICSGTYISPSGDYVWTSTGTYTDTIPNSFGCDSVITVNLTVASPTSSSINPTSCSEFISPSGNYIWTSSGTYQDTIANSAGCDSVITVILTISNLNVSESHTDVSCYEGADGAIDLTVSGGTPGYLYNWSNAATTQDLTNLIAGLYMVTVVDATSCSQTITVSISEPSLLIMSETHTDVSVYGGSDGSITPSATGGTLPYTYDWNPPVSDPNNLSAGTYSITLTDANGCQDSLTVIITEPTGVSLISENNYVSVYPNPASDQLFIESPQNISFIRIYDVLGREIFSKEFNSALCQLNIAHLNSGVYLVKIIIDEGEVVKKIVVE